MFLGHPTIYYIYYIYQEARKACKLIKDRFGIEEVGILKISILSIH